MNVKTMIELPEHQLRYAEKMVEDGEYPSIDSVLVASMNEMMRNADRTADPQAHDPVVAMADELRRRMELPADQWVDWDGESTLDRIKKRNAGKRGA